MSAYDNWLLRGSGAFSTEHETTLDNPCTEGDPECGTTEGIVYVNDFGTASLYCAEGHLIEDDYSPEYDDIDEDAYYERKYSAQ